MYCRHTSKKELLIGKHYTEFLNHKDQVLWGNVTINGNLLVRNAAQITNMRSAQRIDGFDILGMVEDTLKVRTKTPQTLALDTFFSSNVTLGQLSVQGNMFGLGQWSDVQHILESVQQNINMVGPLSFANSFKVDELIVRDAINGIPSGVFGQQWLLRESDQV